MRSVRKFLVLAKMDASGISETLLNKQVMKLRLNEAATIAEHVGFDLADFVCEVVAQRCRVCGCTQEDCSQCIEKTGEPCTWVESDLCSACEK
jgi:hypothetical protein